MVMGPQRKACRFYGTFNTLVVKHEWHSWEVCAIGIEAWADHALEKCVWHLKDLCEECKANDVKVYKPSYQCKKDFYCSLCWYKYVCNMREDEKRKRSNQIVDA